MHVFAGAQFHLVVYALFLLGYVVGGVSRGMAVALIVTTLSLFFSRLSIQSLPVTVSIILMTSVLFSLFGFINAVFANNFDDISIIPTFVLTPLIYLGGVFYSMDLLPEFWANVSRLNPLVYVVNGFRYGVLGVSDIDVRFAFSMIAVFTVVAYLYSLHLLETGKRMRQ